MRLHKPGRRPGKTRRVPTHLMQQINGDKIRAHAYSGEEINCFQRVSFSKIFWRNSCRSSVGV